MLFPGAKIFSLRNRRTRRWDARHGRPLKLEPLEQRHLLALLGITPEPPFVFYDAGGQVNYTASDGLFAIDSIPTAFGHDILSAVDITGAQDLQIRINLDSTGNLLGGVDGDDLTVTGDIDLDGNGSIVLTGRLLGGE